MIFSAVYYQLSLEGYQNVLGPFYLQRVNKFCRKYKLVQDYQQKNQLLIWNSETTQHLNIYLHNYQTETAIFLATKHEKTIMACNYLNFSIQKIYTSKQQNMVAFVRNCLEKMTLTLFFSQFLLL